MEGEIGAAELTGRGLPQSRSAASRATDHGRFVRAGLSDLDDLAAWTVKSAPHLSGRCVELTVAADAGDEVAQGGWFVHVSTEYDKRPVACQFEG